MVALLLLVLTYILFPAFPGFAILTASAAVWGAKSWSGTGQDVVELVFFWGALIGCLMVWLR
jgi:hypothetical protein